MLSGFCLPVSGKMDGILYPRHLLINFRHQGTQNAVSNLKNVIGKNPRRTVFAHNVQFPLFRSVWGRQQLHFLAKLCCKQRCQWISKAPTQSCRHQRKNRLIIVNAKALRQIKVRMTQNRLTVLTGTGASGVTHKRHAA